MQSSTVNWDTGICYVLKDIRWQEALKPVRENWSAICCIIIGPVGIKSVGSAAFSFPSESSCLPGRCSASKQSSGNTIDALCTLCLCRQRGLHLSMKQQIGKENSDNSSATCCKWGQNGSQTNSSFWMGCSKSQCSEGVRKEDLFLSLKSKRKTREVCRGFSRASLKEIALRYACLLFSTHDWCEKGSCNSHVLFPHQGGYVLVPVIVPLLWDWVLPQCFPSLVWMKFSPISIMTNASPQKVCPRLFASFVLANFILSSGHSFWHKFPVKVSVWHIQRSSVCLCFTPMGKNAFSIFLWKLHGNFRPECQTGITNNTLDSFQKHDTHQAQIKVPTILQLCTFQSLSHKSGFGHSHHAHLPSQRNPSVSGELHLAMKETRFRTPAPKAEWHWFVLSRLWWTVNKLIADKEGKIGDKRNLFLLFTARRRDTWTILFAESQSVTLIFLLRVMILAVLFHLSASHPESSDKAVPDKWLSAGPERLKCACFFPAGSAGEVARVGRVHCVLPAPELPGLLPRAGWRHQSDALPQWRRPPHHQLDGKSEQLRHSRRFLFGLREHSGLVESCTCRHYCGHCGTDPPNSHCTGCLHIQPPPSCTTNSKRRWFTWWSRHGALINVSQKTPFSSQGWNDFTSLSLWVALTAKHCKHQEHRW